MESIGLRDEPFGMATVMEFTSPADEFPLGTIFENLPEVTVTMERLLPQESLIVPYFWVRGGQPEDIEACFEAHPGVVSVDLIDSVEDEYLMRAEWDQEYAGILSALTEDDVAVLSAVGTNDGWDFEVRGESREAIREFRTTCQEDDTLIEITAVHSLLPIEGDGGERHGLTDAQREALVLAYERGYFNSPRETSLEDIAEEIGITQQSLSSRLRRGHRQLIGGALITP